MSVTTFLIVCPMLFLAGFVDSIAGGGGLISLPAYLFTGLPIHTAIATNKFSSTFGTALATVRFIGEKLVLLVLPLAAFCVLNRRLFKEKPHSEIVADRRTIIVVTVSALLVGVYDGLYGPGTGTFLIIAFIVVGRMSVARANAHTKVINLSTNIAALTVFLLHGQVLIPLGIAAALSNMAGNYIGSGLVMTKGSKIVKPLVILVLVLLLVKIIAGF